MSDDREIKFGEALTKLVRTARENGGVIDDARVREAFAELSLDEKQMDEVYAYLREKRIGIGAEPEEEAPLPAGERDILAAYIEELGALPAHSEEEKLALAARAIDGDREAQTAYAECLLPLVPDIARLYAEQGVPMEDLIGEGNVALLQGAELLGALEEPGEAEETLSRYVMDAMEALIADNLQEDARGQHAVNRVNEVADRAKELYEDLRRPVTVDELMNETGWSREKIMEAWKLAGGEIEELQVTASDPVS
ncbi:MAG: hypothetical protein K6G16_03385 [Lachnospiraceae bacterium]|nr:hypothetical protein [Lachnospiraceae bacterium]